MQDQRSLFEQMYDLLMWANDNGMYDAFDWLQVAFFEPILENQ